GRGARADRRQPGQDDRLGGSGGNRYGGERRTGRAEHQAGGEARRTREGRLGSRRTHVWLLRVVAGVSSPAWRGRPKTSVQNPTSRAWPEHVPQRPSTFGTNVPEGGLRGAVATRRPPDQRGGRLTRS